MLITGFIARFTPPEPRGRHEFDLLEFDLITLVRLEVTVTQEHRGMCADSSTGKNNGCLSERFWH